MPIPIAAIQEVLRQVDDSAYVRFAPDRPEVRTLSGHIGKWMGRLDGTANRRTMGFFIESLRDRYGGQTTDNLVVSNRIERAMQRGEPLRARQVRDIVGQAEVLTAEHRMFIGSIQPSVPSPARIGPHLAREIEISLSRGFVNQFVLKGDPACEHPLPEETFLWVLAAFNAVMEDLHRRFPRLADIEPPNFSQDNPNTAKLRVRGTYNYSNRTLMFANLDRETQDAYCRTDRAISRATPRAPDFTGTIAHEYSHHLGEVGGLDTLEWSRKLIDTLQREGFVSANTGLDPRHPESRRFTFEVGKNVREMGMGYYAGTDQLEFVAEALAWRLAPGYGESSDIPRMPRYLEDWVHDCFPFARDGAIPDHCVEFDPATIKEPTRVEEITHWQERGSPPHPPPRPRP